MKTTYFIAKTSCFLILAIFCVNFLTTATLSPIETARKDLSEAIYKGDLDEIKDLIKKHKQLIEMPKDKNRKQYKTPLYEAVSMWEKKL